MSAAGSSPSPPTELPVQEMLAAFVAYLPQLAAALAVGLLGWLAAHLARAAIVRTSTRLNRFIEGLPQRRARLLQLSPQVVRIAGDLVFWVVALLFLLAVAALLDLTVVRDWLNQLAAYVPSLVAGVVIIVAGIGASAIAGQVTAAASAPAGSTRSRLLARGVQIAVGTVAIVLGMGQLGLDMTLPVALIVVVVATILGGVTLAFALGGRDLVADLIGAQGLQRHGVLQRRVRVDDLEGQVVELTATSLVLATAEGRAVVPARVFHERAIVVLDTVEDVPADD